MPLLLFMGSIWYQGSKEAFDALSLTASFWAGQWCGIETVVQGTPPVFFPKDPNFANVQSFLFNFCIAFQRLVALIEQGRMVYDYNY